MAERQDVIVGTRMRLSDVLQTQNAPDEPMRMRLGDVMSLGKEETPELNKFSFFQVSPKQIAQWKALGPIGYSEQAIRQDKTEMIPFNPESAVKSFKLLNAVNRIKRDRYETNPEQKNLDIDFINKFLMKSEEERIRGFSIGGKITQGAAALPGYMIEFLLTGGAAAVGRQAVAKSIKPIVKTIVKRKALKFTTRVAGGLAGAVVRTAAMPHRVIGSFAERQIDASLELTEQGLQLAEESREKPFTSAMKGFGDIVIENFSEVTGPTLGKMASKVVPKKMALGLTKLFKKLHPGKSLKTLFTKAGYNGFLEELGEERVGALLRAVTGVENYGADNPDSMFDRVIASIPDGEEMLVEAGVLAIPGALHAGAQQTNRIIQGRKITERPGETIIDKKTGEPKVIEGFEEGIGNEVIDEILATEEVKPEIEEEIKPEIQPLIEEAKKYKTAEEFVGSQGKPLYHGTAQDFEDFDITKAGTLKTSDWGTKGIYFDPNKSGADYYRNEALQSTDKKANELMKQWEKKAKEMGTSPMMASIDLGFNSDKYNELEKYREKWMERLSEIEKDTSKGRIIEAYIDPKAKVYKHIYEAGMITNQTLSDEMMDKGYDAVEIWDRDRDTKEKWLSEVIVMNPKVIKTKSQLTDIWKQAQAKPTEVKPTIAKEEVIKPEKIKPDVSGVTILSKEIQALKEREAIVSESKFALEEINTVREYLKGRITRYRDEYLKEELTGIPKYYITKEGGLKPDEILDELRTHFNIDLRDETALKEYLQNLEAQHKSLLAEIEKAKPKLIVKRETTLLKHRIQDISRGVRLGTITTKKQIKQTQTELIGMIEKSGIEAKDRAKFIRAIKNTQTVAQLSKIFPEIEKRLTTLKETSESKALRVKINKALKTTKPKKQAGKPVGKFTPKIQDVLDKARIYAKLTGEEVQERITAYVETIGDDIPTADQALENRILSLFGGLKDKSSVELKETLTVLRDLIEKGRSENLEHFEDRKIKLVGEVNSSLQSVVGRKTPSKRRIKGAFEKIRKAISAPFKTFLGWDNILNLLAIDDKVAPGESALEKTAKVSGNETAEKKTIRVNIEKVTNAALKAFNLKTNSQLMKQWRQDTIIQEIGTFKNARDEEVILELSKAEARKIWMESQDPTLVDTLISDKGNAYSPDMIQAIEDFLTQEDRNFALAQLRFYRDFYEEIVNPVYSDIYGINLPFNEFYSPISREHKEKLVVDTFLKEIGFRRSVTTGSLKSRIKNLSPIKIQSDIAALQKHIMEMAHFVSWAEKIRQLNAIFTNNEIKDVVNKKFGGEMQKVIADFMKDFTRGGIDRAKNFGAWDKIRVNFTRAKLSIKTSLLLKQMVSFVAFADDVPLTSFMKGVTDFVLHPVKSTKTLNQSEVMRARGANLTRDIKDAALSDEFSAFRTRPSFRNMLMILTKIGDRGAILVGGWSVYKYTLEKTGSATKAMEAFEEKTSATQQSADLSQLSIWQRGNTFQKMFTMFTSSQNQYFRKEYMAIRNLIAGKQSVGKTAKTILIYHFLLPMFFQWVVDFGKWNKDEQLRAAILGSFNGVFIIKDILDSIIREAIGLRRFDLSIAPFSIVDGIFKAMNAIDIDDITSEDVLSALLELDSTVGGLAGLPAEQVKNMVEGIGDIYEDEAFRGALRLLGWTEWIIDNNEE